jgi:DNA repair protein RadD
LKAAASTEQLIKGDTPIVEVFKVDHITYAVHRKHDVPDMIRVSYYCGLRMFNEFVCIEHEGFAGRKARHWWRDRTDTPMPATTAEALEIADTLKPATHLRMWVNKKYHEILKTCFDNTAFGTVEADGELPSIEPTGKLTDLNIIKPNLPSKQTYPVTDQYDDDIPF